MSSPPQETSRRRTVVAGLATVVGIFLRGAVGLLSVRLCLAFIGREAFAVWVFVQNASGYFALSEAGVGQATLNQQGKAYADGDTNFMSRVLVSATGLYFGLILIAAVVAISFLMFAPIGAWLPRDLPLTLTDAVPMYLGAAVGLVLFAVPLTSFAATLSGARFHHVRQMLDAALPVVTIASLALSLYLGGGLWAAILVTPVLQIVWGLVYLVTVKKMIPGISIHPSLFSPGLARQMLGHAMFFFLIGFCLLGYRALPTLLVGRHGGVDDVSQIYSLVLLLRVLGWSMMDVISRVLQPYIILFEHQKKMERIEFFTRLAVVVTNAGAFLLTLGIFCFGRRILEVWLGGTINISFAAIGALGLSFMLDVALLPVFNTLVAMNRHRRLGLLMLAQSLTMILLGEGLARTIFSDRPVVGILAGILTASFFAAVFAGRFIAAPGLQMPFERFAKSILPRSIVFFGLALVAAGLLQLLDEHLISRIAIFVCMSLAAGLATWFGLMSGEERNYLRSFIEKSKRGNL